MLALKSNACVNELINNQNIIMLQWTTCIHCDNSLFRPNTVYTFQALSEEDLELWLDAMDGKEPVYERPLRPSDASQTFLDEAGFNFIQRCIQVLEYRGLEEQGCNSIGI